MINQKRPRIRPHPAIVVRANVTIGDCVRVMKEKNTGSVLVVSDTESQDLVGIFTERDLVRVIQLVDEGHHLEKPVRTVMTRNVRTIDLARVNEALGVMVEHGIRHLPVVSTDETGKVRIVGVVSMRDFARKV